MSEGHSAVIGFIALPLFLLYSVSAFAASAVILLRPLPPPVAAGIYASSSPRLLWLGNVDISDPGKTAAAMIRGLRVGGVAGLFLLAFGTGCDNARTLAGAFEMCAPGWLRTHCRTSCPATTLLPPSPPLDAS